MDKPNKATAALKEELGVEDVEAPLGHAQERLVETFMRSSPLSLMREALDRWNDHLAGLLKAKSKTKRQAGR